MALPVPRVAITIRPGTIDDLPFLDSLQKLHTKQVGWMPTKTLEGKIKLGHVLIAEHARGQSSEGRGQEGNDPSSLTFDLCPLPSVPVGYLIGNDQYFKHDDIGIIYQMNVLPGKQRGLIGATLLKAQFDRSAYGCKLYCCWCAQDIAANRFWESVGFLPLAFRAGSATRGKNGGARVHIFWQKRIRAGDSTTPWWFPSQTTGGSIREDRLVFPIPPGTHWSDAKPIVLPKDTHGNTHARQIEDTSAKVVKARKGKVVVTVPNRASPLSGGLTFCAPIIPQSATEKAAIEKARPVRAREKVKNDPKYIAAARELRDRWLEKVNADPSMIESNSK
ncbi:hypothetical protein BH09PLA1_BH09PLA1_06460 [soil metagenome]